MPTDHDHVAPTLADVATAAGVSPATASRALRPIGVEQVQEDTRRHVQETAARIGYRRRKAHYGYNRPADTATPTAPDLTPTGWIVARTRGAAGTFPTGPIHADPAAAARRARERNRTEVANGFPGDTWGVHALIRIPGGGAS